MESQFSELKITTNDLIEQFKGLVVSHLLNSNSMLSTQNETEEKYQQLIKNIDIFKKSANIDDKRELFHYLLPCYLSGDFQQIYNCMDEYEKQMREYNMENNSQQRTLFNENNFSLTKSSSYKHITGISMTSANYGCNSEPLFLEKVLSKIFFKFNFFSKPYVNDFIVISEKLLINNKKHSQGTISPYIDKKSPRILQDPFTTRIADFINKTGREFLNGLANIDLNKVESSKIKGLLQDYLESHHGDKLFPDWFKKINRDSKSQIVKELIK